MKIEYYIITCSRCSVKKKIYDIEFLRQPIRMPDHRKDGIRDNNLCIGSGLSANIQVILDEEKETT